MTQPEALLLAEVLIHLPAADAKGHAYQSKAAAELRRLHHNNLTLTNALWKACGDDREVVNATIESQGELK